MTVLQIHTKDMCIKAKMKTAKFQDVTKILGTEKGHKIQQTEGEHKCKLS